MQRYGVELRAEITGDRLAGHAVVFGAHAEVRGGWETIAPTAFDKALQRGDDVRALVNHNPGMLLGRSSAGTLKLGTDSTGLQFEVELPNTSYANDLRELVARGDLTGASFGFIPGTDEIGRADDGRQLRTHTSVARLMDVSAVTFPAYDETAVALRHVVFQPVDWKRVNRDQAIRARAAQLRKRYA